MPLYSIWSIFIFLSSLDGKTPLLYAAEAGHDQIVAYLLQFREVCTDLKEQPQRVDSASVRARLLMQDLLHKPLPLLRHVSATNGALQD